MGSPRNILELAREMILLSGFEPEKDIETTFTGLRPGEKLSEELVASTERLVPTRFEKLSVIEPQYCDECSLLYDIDRLVQTARNNDPIQVYEILRNMDMGFNLPVNRARARAAAASN
jgi:FlaA1/EpsC-like NDP-sugar epimerase